MTENTQRSRDRLLPFMALLFALMMMHAWYMPEFATAQAQSPSSAETSDATKLAIHAQTSVQVLWADSDQIDGQFLQWRDGIIQLASPLFTAPVHLRAGLVETIRFANRTASPAGGSPHQLVLVDGSTLVGKVVSTNDNAVIWNDDRFGELSIDLSKIASLQSNSQVIYAWNGDIHPWRILQGQWTVDSQQRLTTQQPDSKIWLPFELDQSSIVEFEVVSPQTLDFVIATGQDVESSYRLARIGDEWIAGTSSDFEIIEALSERPRQLTLSLRWNATSRKLSILQGNQTLVEVSDQPAATVRSGILLENLGSSLTVKSLRIVGATQSVGAASLPKVSGTVKEPPTRSMDRIVWKDGTGLWCSIREFSQATLTVDIELLNQTKTCTVEKIASIIPQAIPTAEKSSVTEFRLQQGKSMLTGTCEFSFEPVGVQWRSSKLDRPVEVNLELPLSLVRQEKVVPSLDNSGRFTALAHLRSGTMVPCRLERADLTGTWLATPFNDQPARVDNRRLCAVELKPNRTKPAFTKESREMTLSIPRNLEVDLYSHVLIGQNGDLLRGNLVSISDRTIELDSRLEPILVERQFVDTVVFMHPTPESNTESRASQTMPQAVPQTVPQTEEYSLRLQLAGGFSVGGAWTGGDSSTIALTSAELGSCRIDASQIQSFHFQSELVAPDSEGQAYVAWSPHSLIAPRWKAAPDRGEDSSRSLVGTAAPQVTLPNSRGETVNLADHVGKVVVIDFWATWCGPCVASLPKYLEKVQKYADNQVVFFGINSTETPESVREFLQSKTWPEFDTLFDYDGEVAKAMLVQGIPHTIVIGRDGKIAHIQIGYSPKGAEELQQAIEKQLD